MRVIFINEGHTSKYAHFNLSALTPLEIFGLYISLEILA